MNTSLSASVVSASNSRRGSRRALIAAISGNVIEWYDYSVYAFFAVFIGRAFFPASNPIRSLLSTLAVFGVGFAARPIGSIVFGQVDQRLGRRTTLAISILMMAGSTFVIGVLPSYQTAGIASTVLLVIARLVQGLSGGGAWASSGLFIVEAAPANRRGLFSSFHQSGVGIGLLAGSFSATLTTSVLSAEAAASFGWRLPFLFGGILALVGLLLRFKVPEQREPLPVDETGQRSNIALVEAWRNNKLEMLMVMGVFLSATVNFYVFLSYLPVYANVVLHIPQHLTFLASTIGLCAFPVSTVISGLLSDHIGRKPLLIAHAGGIALIAWPMFTYLQTHRDFITLLAVQIVGVVLLGAFAGSSLAAIVEMFPARVRYAAVAVPQALVSSLFGGTSGFIVTAMVAATGNPVSVVFYIIPTALISLVTFFAMRETYKHELR